MLNTFVNRTNPAALNNRKHSYNNNNANNNHRRALLLPASAPLPPRFFQLDSASLQTGLEERIRDAIHSSISPLVSAQWMEEFRALVEVSVSSAIFGLGLMSSSSLNTSSSASHNNQGYTITYGDHIYNLRYVVATSSFSLFSSISNFIMSGSFSSRPDALMSSTMSSTTSAATGGGIKNNNLFLRLIIRFVLLSLLPVFSRLLQRRYLQREEEVPVLSYVRNFEKVLRVLDLMNHISFLYSGTHRHVVDRLLGIRLASGERELQLSAHTYLIDRQHYWQTMFAAMSLFIPLLNVGGWARYFGNGVRRLLYLAGASLTTPTSRGTNNDDDGDINSQTTGNDNDNSRQQARRQGHQRSLSNATERFECLICHTEPMAMPRRVKECGHVCVCYYCSQTAKVDACPECHGYCSGFVE